MSVQASTQKKADASANGQVGVLLAAVAIAFTGQMTLNPIIAPLSREIGLAEWQVGLTISVAALMVVLFSPIWGRRAQAWGSRTVLIAALGFATVVMVAFAGVVGLGLAGVLGPVPLFVAFLVLRGLCYGAAVAAVMPTAQAHIAAVTTDEATRVKGMAGVGAAQGAASILGAIVGGVLVVFGLMVPMIAVPVMLALALTLAWAKLQRPDAATLVARPAGLRATDPRVLPYLIAGFGMFLAFGFVQVITGFLVQDRLHLEATAAGAFAGIAFLMAGIGMLVSQVVLIPRQGWGPHRLMRVGIAFALTGFVVLLPDAGLWLLLVAMLLIGLGLGFAIPGYTAGPTLLVRDEEQGALAGLIGATNGLTFIIAPTAATLLYGLGGWIPVAVSVVLLACVMLFLVLDPRFSAGQASA